MTVSGSLQTMELAAVMQWCKGGGKTGTLSLTRERMEKQLFFEEGLIVAASSDDPREYLGQFLVSFGKISEEQLNLAFEVQRKTNILLGRVLVARKFLSEEDVREVQERKIKESLFALFLWKEGEFRFDRETFPFVGRRVEVRVDPEKCLFEAARRVDEWKRYRAVFPHDRTLVKRTGKKAPSFGKDSIKRKILDFAGEGMTIERMCLELRTYSFALLEALHDLHRSGLVTAAGEEKRPAARKKPQRFGSEEEEITWFYEKIFPPGKIPKLAVSVTTMKKLSMTSEEAFIVSRVNGIWDVRSIATICPIREIETLRALKRLVDEEVLELL